MQVYDISQEVFSCTVFPGDSLPERKVLMKISEGEICNLTAFSMCAHNGTHVDAPNHFYDAGKTVEQLDLNKLVGPCFVYTKDGELSSQEALDVIKKAHAQNPECAKRLLFKGHTTVTSGAAEVFASHKIFLIGNESQTVGPEDAPKQVHLILLKEEIVLLEGIRLNHVSDGEYILNAAPLNLGGSDGAPCRAILLKL